MSAVWQNSGNYIVTVEISLPSSQTTMGVPLHHNINLYTSILSLNKVDDELSNAFIKKYVHNYKN